MDWIELDLVVGEIGDWEGMRKEGDIERRFEDAWLVNLRIGI